MQTRPTRLCKKYPDKHTDFTFLTRQMPRSTFQPPVPPPPKYKTGVKSGGGFEYGSVPPYSYGGKKDPVAALTTPGPLVAKDVGLTPAPMTQEAFSHDPRANDKARQELARARERNKTSGGLLAPTRGVHQRYLLRNMKNTYEAITTTGKNVQTMFYPYLDNISKNDAFEKTLQYLQQIESAPVFDAEYMQFQIALNHVFDHTDEAGLRALVEKYQNLKQTDFKNSLVQQHVQKIFDDIGNFRSTAKDLTPQLINRRENFQLIDVQTDYLISKHNEEVTANMATLRTREPITVVPAPTPTQPHIYPNSKVMKSQSDAKEIVDQTTEQLSGGQPDSGHRATRATHGSWTPHLGPQTGGRRPPQEVRDVLSPSVRRNLSADIVQVVAAPSTDQPLATKMPGGGATSTEQPSESKMPPPKGKGDSMPPSKGKGESMPPSKGKGDSMPPSKGKADSMPPMHPFIGDMFSTPPIMPPMNPFERPHEATGGGMVSGLKTPGGAGSKDVYELAESEEDENPRPGPPAGEETPPWARHFATGTPVKGGPRSPGVLDRVAGLFTRGKKNDDVTVVVNFDDSAKYGFLYTEKPAGKSKYKSHEAVVSEVFKVNTWDPPNNKLEKGDIIKKVGWPSPAPVSFEDLPRELETYEKAREPFLVITYTRP